DPSPSLVHLLQNPDARASASERATSAGRRRRSLVGLVPAPAPEVATGRHGDLQEVVALGPDEAPEGEAVHGRPARAPLVQHGRLQLQPRGRVRGVRIEADEEPVPDLEVVTVDLDRGTTVADVDQVAALPRARGDRLDHEVVASPQHLGPLALAAIATRL